MILFKKVKFKNLLSFGQTPTEIILNKNTTTLVQGKNGGGKSAALLDSITFALFGKPFRKINKPTLINTKNKKELLVELEFSIDDDEYIIKRGLSPNLFEIWKNGVLINEDSTTRDYQNYLEEYILKFDFQIFTQLVILGKASYVSFMRMDAANRRKFIERILGLTIFSLMNEVYKKEIVDLKDQIKEINSDLKLIKEKIQIRNDYIKVLKENKKQEKEKLLEQQEKEKNYFKTNIENLESEIAKYKQMQEIIDNEIYNFLLNKKEKLLEIKSKTNMKTSQISKELDFFNKNKFCPTCGQSITHEFAINKKNELNEKQNKLNELTEKLLQDIEKTNQEFEQLQTKMSNNKQIEIKIIELKKQINQFEKKLKDLEKTHNLTNNDDNDKIQTEIANLESLKQEFEQKLEIKNDLLEKQEYYELIGLMLKDTGIKSVIIKKYLPIINNLINNYLKELNFFVKFKINENFEETILIRGTEQNYYNFSEGEKLRIDLAILMAWREIARIQGVLNTNLFIFDEILDASIDTQGVENLLNVIDSMKDKNIFVISHSPNKWEDKFRSNLMFGKVNGFSKIINH